MLELSLRDLFAGLAMHAELVELRKNEEKADAFKIDAARADRINFHHRIAHRAYEVADAMLMMRGD